MAKKKDQADQGNAGAAPDSGGGKRLCVTNDGGITVHQINAGDLKTWEAAGYKKYVPVPAKPKSHN